MADVALAEAGSYRYIKGQFQYSGGVAAEPGFELERVRFARALPLADGFSAVEAHLKSLGRPNAAFAACELRSPEPFTEQGFIEFNKGYVKTLERWGIYQGGDAPVNPVARTNVCPVHGGPSEPVMHAFTYTVPARRGSSAVRGGFVLAGAGESRRGDGSHRSRIVRLGDTSAEGLREKVAAVMAEMERRLQLLGYTWADALATQAYTVHDIGYLVGEVFAARGACAQGLTWSYARPPIVDIEFEMDVRAAARELVI